MNRVRAALALSLVLAVPLFAQSSDSSVSSGRALPSTDQAIQLAQQGQGDKARALLDSVLRAATPADSVYADALYWRASLSSSGLDSARYYDRLLIETPLSPRVEDALVQLATLDEAHGNRAAAADHLTRFMLSYADSPQRASVSVTLVRLLFDDGQVARGCAALAWARDAVRPDNVELRNRIEYYAPRCANLPVDSAVAPDTAVVPPPVDTTAHRPRRASPRAPATAHTAPASAPDSVTVYSLQVAAYDTKAPADRAAKALVARGIDARVDGTVRPFRVRIGKYPTQAAALQAVAALKTKGITGFLTTSRVPRR